MRDHHNLTFGKSAGELVLKKCKNSRKEHFIVSGMSYNKVKKNKEYLSVAVQDRKAGT